MMFPYSTVTVREVKPKKITRRPGYNQYNSYWWWNQSRTGPFFRNSAEWCCAFPWIQSFDPYPQQTDAMREEQYEFLLTRAALSKRPAFLSVTERQAWWWVKWKDCPYATLLGEEQTRMTPNKYLVRFYKLEVPEEDLVHEKSS